MTAPFRLRPEDRPDFEAVLHLALNTSDIRTALAADPTGRKAARLRLRALTAADEIATAARDEYDTYIALHDPAHENDEDRPADNSLLPALAVPTPAVAGTSAAVLLVLGYVLRLTDAQRSLAASLITSGWILALIAAVGTLIAFAALLTHAVRRQGGPRQPARLEQARLKWQQALLTQGMLPRLRHYMSEATSRSAASESHPATGDGLPHTS
ncbi:hypothetical protein OG426_09185 [Streptomyces canus]|uniref:hypothetical protein n=1 Tax=Streptomyces canus TaxID=58343 RepID=UPI00224DD510|nr:hypothetical protein [Streptomyces canus]MCX4862268.1 hypothetical protein [Streptomyces canus]WSW32628.1 hypothetical protein OG426_09185 [Streptomyces canus]